ncbi:MAG TPA: hypothetical protein VGD64_04220 [Acidisarcina sp.]
MNTSICTRLLISALALSPALHAAQQTPTVRSLGVISMQQASNLALTSPLLSPQLQKNIRPLPRPQQGNAALGNFVTVPIGPKFPVMGTTPGELGFVGTDSLTNSQAIGFTLEPPDQGLASNGPEVFEVVNLSLQIYSNTGTHLTPAIGLPQFFGVPPNANLTDPRVFFDPYSQRFFLTVLEYFFDPNTGLLLGSQDLLAVSTTNDALGFYYEYSIDACSAFDETCLGDQPLTGVNENGFYLSNNDFGNFTFDGAFVTALDKQALIAGSPLVNGTSTLLPNDFSVEPALPAPGAVSTQNNGTEYFSESLDFGAGGNTLRVFQMTNTSTLPNLIPATTLTSNDFPTEAYSNPVPATQKASPNYPLGQSLGAPEEQVDTNDDRMLQLYYGKNKLYTTLETQLVDPNPKIGKSGGAWFIIEPPTPGASPAHILSQGYIGIQGATVLFPAFAVDINGNGVLGYSFCGNDYFPSAGYSRVTLGKVEQVVHLARPGEAPDDGFSGYAAFGGNGVGRWGDYSAATISPDGHVWFAAEYIASQAIHRTYYTNWSTFIAQVQ